MNFVTVGLLRFCIHSLNPPRAATELQLDLDAFTRMVLISITAAKAASCGQPASAPRRWRSRTASSRATNTRAQLWRWSFSSPENERTRGETPACQSRRHGGQRCYTANRAAPQSGRETLKIGDAAPRAATIKFGSSTAATDRRSQRRTAPVTPFNAPTKSRIARLADH